MAEGSWNAGSVRRDGAQNARAPATPGGEPGPARRSRRTLTVIFALCAAPIILGTLAFYFFQPRGHTNYGRLITPHPFVVPARMEDGAAVAPAALADKWWLVTVERGACADPCQRKLLYTRQFRLALGKDQDRVERLLITDAAGNGADGVPPALREHLRIAVGARTAPVAGAAASPAQSAGAPPPAGAPAGGEDLFAGEEPTAHIYLVDPFGNLMMSFPADGDPQRMLRDIEHLLRVNSWVKVSR